MAYKQIYTAARRRDDEWYTRYEDVEKELAHYSFNGMRVLCPCDSPESSFTQYFLNNFHRLGLKSLTYAWIQQDMTAFMSTFDGKTTVTEPISILGFEDAKVTGALMKSDIVVTNPPFSLCSKKFFRWILDNRGRDMNFILVGCLFWFSYQDFVRNYLYKDRKVYPGFEKINSFRRPDGSDETLGNTFWLQTLRENYSRNIQLSNTVYSPEKFRHYGTPELANVPYVDKCENIPKDYFGVMAVPLSFVLTRQSKDYEIVDLYNGKTKRTGVSLADGKPYFTHLAVVRKR